MQNVILYEVHGIINILMTMMIPLERLGIGVVQRVELLKDVLLSGSLVAQVLGRDRCCVES